MSSASIKKIIPCKKDQLIEMVLDIEKYPEFVPWCIEGKIFDKNESLDLPERISTATEFIKGFVSIGLQLTMTNWNNK